MLLLTMMMVIAITRRNFRFASWLYPRETGSFRAITPPAVFLICQTVNREIGRAIKRASPCARERACQFTEIAFSLRNEGPIRRSDTTSARTSGKVDI